ncbi:MAG: ATPase, T2SS/T4P/T4SS family [Ilumatobacteraceae bacterium]
MNDDLVTLVDSVRDQLRHRTDLALEPTLERTARRLFPLVHERDLTGLLREARSELVGLGPLEHLLADPSVTEVMVNRGCELWVDRSGRPERCGELPPDRAMALVERIIHPLGLRLDRTHPIVDARLADGQRLCAVAPPIAPDGVCFSIRRFTDRILGLEDFAPDPVVEVLAELVDAMCNVVVSGATSSGKTTLLGALIRRADPADRIVTIEDTAELRLGVEHAVRLECRAGEHGVDPVDLGRLVRTALRLRPDRLVVGEVRGAEVVDLVQALNTGHDGSFATCHANSPADAIRRLESLVVLGAPSWPLPAVREQLRSSVDAIVHVARTRDGHRRVVDVVEVPAPGSPDAPRPLADATCRLGTVSRIRR